MSKAAIAQASVFALVSAVLYGASTSLVSPAASGAQSRDQVAQYCVPPDDAREAPRVYCRIDEG